MLNHRKRANMGMSFSTIQIQNRKQIKQEQFQNILTEYMKTKGFISSTEEESELWYSFIFSRNKGWISISSSDYEDEATNTMLEDMQELIKSMKTVGVMTQVIDSDMVILNGFDESGVLRDKVVLGDSEMAEGLGGDSSGSSDFWKPLFISNHTWEQWQEICNKNYDWPENALFELAPILGMDKEMIGTYGWDNRPELLDLVITQYYKVSYIKAQPEQNIVLASENNDTPPPKRITMPSLDKGFKQVFGEALAPLGYKKIKGKHPYFVRLIGDEILHIITYVNDWSDHPNFKCFSIWGGIATVYRKGIDLLRSPKDNIYWLIDNLTLYKWSNPFDFDRTRKSELRTITYEKDNVESLFYGLRQSLNHTQEIMLPVFNKVIDLNSCIEYFYKYNKGILLNIYFDESLDNKFGDEDYNEGLILIKVKNRDNGIKRGYEYSKIITNWRGIPRSKEENKRIEEVRLNRIAIRDRILDTLEIYTEALGELERRKNANTKLLRNYGLNI